MYELRKTIPDVKMLLGPEELGFSCVSTQQTNLGIRLGEGSQFAEDVTGRTSASRAANSTS